MAKESSQKFIGRNRAPRVHITYDLETAGMPKVELPMVMGVMADLSGKPAEPLAPVSERKFLEVDVDNFDDRMKGMKPRVAFQVDNALTDDGGKMNVELTFESMDDFSPAAIARKTEGLRQMLEAREQLDNLRTWMDGKDKAEQKLSEILNDPALLSALAATKNPEASKDEE
ncbi:MAG: type VI secretion system contractile sheath small subunit [Phycisphaerales bacterium]